MFLRSLCRCMFAVLVGFASENIDDNLTLNEFAVIITTFLEVICAVFKVI